MMVAKVLLTLGSVAAISGALVGPRVFRVGSKPSCEPCSIIIENEVALHGINFDGPATVIDRGRGGEVYVVDRRDGVLKVFDADGRTVRQIGRRGGGPGEYEMIRNVIVARDGSVNVLDGTLGRRSVFTSSGALIGSTPLPVQGGTGMPAVLLPDNQLVINAMLRSAGDAGNALLRVDKHGRRTLLFDEEIFDFSQTWRQQRLLWRRTNGDLLVARPYSFSIDVYGTDFSIRKSFVRVADWIPSEDIKATPGDGMFDKPYTPRLRGVWEDAKGRLWLHMMVPSVFWKPTSPLETAQPVGPDALSELAKRPRVDTIIEVLDPKGEHVLARTRIEGPIGLPFGGGYFARSIRDTQGEPGIAISRVRLKQ